MVMTNIELHLKMMSISLTSLDTSNVAKVEHQEVSHH
jgi:hypothetical protein